MREMAAIEALKSEKAEKEVLPCPIHDIVHSNGLVIARTATIDRHFWCFWPPKASCL